MVLGAKNLSKRILISDDADDDIGSHYITVSNSQKLQNLIGDRVIANSQ